MAEVRVQRDTKVILQLSEGEAGRLMGILATHTNWVREAWAESVYKALDAEGIIETQAP